MFGVCDILTVDGSCVDWVDFIEIGEFVGDWVEFIDIGGGGAGENLGVLDQLDDDMGFIGVWETGFDCDSSNFPTIYAS